MSFGTDIVSEEEVDIEDYSKYLYPEFYDCYSVDEIPDYVEQPVVDEYQVEMSESQDIVNQKEPTQPLSDPMDSSWPMFQHDAKHTGRSPYGKDGDWRILKWKFKASGLIEGSPVIDNDGILYFGAREFYAIYPDGSFKWKYPNKGRIESTAAIDNDGNIYFGTTLAEGNYFHSLFPNGTLKWKFSTGDHIKSSPVIGNNGVIYFGDDNNKIYAIYPNGTLKWEYDTSGLIHTNPAIGTDGIIYCGSADHFLYALYPNNGTVKWKYNAGCRIGGDPTIAEDGIIYFGGVEEGALYALYTNGSLKWKLKLGTNVVSSPALANDGTIFVAAYKGSWGANIYSINSDSSINWQYEVDDEAVSASPAIDKYGNIYIGGWSGNLYALNPDGSLKWNYHTNDAVFSSASIGEDGTIYFGSWDEYLYAIEPIVDDPPDIPEIDGPSNGQTGTEYTYTASTTDPDGDNISYYFTWGDGGSSGWTDFVPSGTSVSLNHSWQQTGSYPIKVKAKDVYGYVGKTETLWVTIPKNKATNNNLLFQFFEQFPILHKILPLMK